MRVLLGAALANLHRLTPHNISCSIWALSKLAGQGSGAVAGQGVGMQVPTVASGSTVGGSNADRSHPAGPSGYSRAQGEPHAHADAEGFRVPNGTDVPDSDVAVRLEGIEDEALRPTAPASSWPSTEAATLQLLEGLARATAVRAAEFKPAHVGDALWGFGSLGMHPGDAVLSGLLDAAMASSPSGFKSSNGVCALIGLGRLVAAHPQALKAQHVPAGRTTGEGAPDVETDGNSEKAAERPGLHSLSAGGGICEHPALDILAEVVGAAAPSLALDRLAEVPLQLSPHSACIPAQAKV